MASIIKLMLGGFFTYFIFSAILVGRDMFLHYLIQKFIITDSLNSLIKRCETDHWYLNNQYNKYFEKRMFYKNRYESANASIVRKNNLLTWLLKHYNQTDNGNPILKLRENAYKAAGVYETLKKSNLTNKAK